MDEEEAKADPNKVEHVSRSPSQRSAVQVAKYLLSFDTGLLREALSRFFRVVETASAFE